MKLTRGDGTLIFEAQAETVAELVQLALETGADLTGANLRGADLRGANLDETTKIASPIDILAAQVGPLRAYKLVDANGRSPIQSSGKLEYTMGAEVAVADADTDRRIECAAGLNVADLAWCQKQIADGIGARVLVVEFAAEDIAAIPYATDSKFCLHRCRVVDEVDPQTGKPLEAI
jgi:hypothetical protein